MTRARSRAGTLGRISLVGGWLILSSCASNPPPPTAPPPSAASETLPATPAPEAEAAPAASTETPPQAQVDCQAPEDCKSKGEPGAGFQWACDGGRCMEQAAAEPAKGDEALAEKADEKPQQKGKKKVQKKK
jgi:hypothetical protein